MHRTLTGLRELASPASARWVWLAPVAVGGVLAITALLLTHETRQGALPGSFDEAELFVEQVTAALDVAERDGNNQPLEMVAAITRETARARSEALFQQSPSQAAQMEAAVVAVVDSASRVAAGNAGRADFDRAVVSFLIRVGHLQDGLIAEDTGAFARLRSVTLASVSVILVGTLGAAAAMRYSDRAMQRIAARETESAQLVQVKNRELEQLVRTDSLTGLLNRAALIEAMPSPVAPFGNGASDALGVVFVDLDRFKVTNDALGHRVGDALLAAVAQRMQQVWPQPELIARLGGDEFALVLEAPNSDVVASAVEQLRVAMNVPMFVEGFELDVPISVGVAVGPDDGRTSESLLAHADLAMFAAKRAGGGRAAWFQREMDQHAADRRAIEAGLRIALDRREFRLEFQPIVRSSARTTESLEALIRWDHPERGVIMPAEFIGVAEETGLIAQIGDWALQEAISQLSAWSHAGLEISAAVNISPRQLHVPGLAARVIGLLDEHRVAPERLTLEVTEAAIIEHHTSAIDELTQLRVLGVRVALDDFGIGYSSLARFHRLPLDVLKIDRVFVDGVRDPALPQPAEVAVIEAAVLLAHTNGMIVVAEGIETEAQMRMVQSLGCDLAQGFLFARPARPEDLAFVTGEPVAA